MINQELRLAVLLGWHDILRRYRRSTLGQFWITLSLGIMILCLGFVFGRLFKTPPREFLPFLSLGLISWNFISTTLTEGCAAFMEAEGIIKQLKLSLRVHILRILCRNIIILGHNLLIVPVIFFVLEVPLTFISTLSLLGVLIVSLNLIWGAIVLGIVCTRFRDIPQIIQSGLQVTFYLTPIIWHRDLLSGKAGLFLIEANPFFHLVELIRAPILGTYPSLVSWVTSIITAILGSLFAAWVYRKYSHRVPYWL